MDRAKPQLLPADGVSLGLDRRGGVHQFGCWRKHTACAHDHFWSEVGLAPLKVGSLPEARHHSRSFTLLGVPENHATKGYASLTGVLDWLLLGHWQVLAGCGLGQYRSRSYANNAMTSNGSTQLHSMYLPPRLCKRPDYDAASVLQRLDRITANMQHLLT